jgi:hypothetical protein
MSLEIFLKLLIGASFYYLPKITTSGSTLLLFVYIFSCIDFWFTKNFTARFAFLIHHLRMLIGLRWWVEIDE